MLAIVSGVPPARQPVRMEAIDEPIEHRGRDVVGVVGVHLLRGRDLLFLPFDFLRRERRIAGNIRHQVHRQVEGVLHHDGADRGEVVAGSGPEDAADRVDLIGNLLRAPGRGA